MMSLESKCWRAYFCTIIAGVAFGRWQHSWWAGLFMTIVVLLFSGLVVAVQHYLSRLVFPRGE